MPGKSRRKRGKLPQSRKARSGQRPVAAMRAPAAGVPRRTVSRPDSSSPVVEAPLSAAAASPIQHPYIGVELRTIGILAATMIAILFVLYAVLA